MLENLRNRPLIPALVGGIGIIVVATVLGIVLSREDTAPQEPKYASITSQGPYITVESAELNADAGRAHPVRIRVEDLQGIATVQVQLGDNVVWSPTILSGQSTVYTTYPWIPEATGDYLFDISATTIDGRSATKQIQLSSGCCPPTEPVNVGYTVEAGDDIASIAENFGVCFDELLAVNPNLADIAPGDVLQIPYRPTSESTAGKQTADDCAPIPENYITNPDLLTSIPRRDTAFPTSGTTITRGFSCQPFYTGYKGTNCPADAPWFHTGLDIDLEEGDPITSVDGGIVTYAGPDVTSNADCSNVGGSVAPHNGYGRHVRIERDGWLFLYAHLTAAGVEQGDNIDGSGLLVGWGGSTGCSTGDHLHLEIRHNGLAIDPLQYINSLTGQNTGTDAEGDEE